MDSHCVGLTLPGIMELPGSFSGIDISPKPQRGPLANQRTSFAIFIKFAASAFKAPCAKTISSLDVNAWNLFPAVTNSFPVNFETASATFTSKPLGAFRPVPTAVPPRASSLKGFSESLISSTSLSNDVLQPEIS